jgi:uncharacterized membrane protein YsdA (DUF1294 family)/cold shock CspA family protein
MRLKGTIVEWKDDRGFGFIEPSDGSAKVFCHVKAFEVRVRRPIAGDNITYEIAKGKDGRLSASRVRPVGLEEARYQANVSSKKSVPPAKVRPPRELSPASIVFALLVVIAFHVGVGVLVLDGRIPYLVIFVYLGMSSATLIAYLLDKSAAMNRRWRIKEEQLHLLELLGGWPGALFAQQAFRHKSRKGSYRIVFWICVVLNVSVLLYFSFPEWRA